MAKSACGCPDWTDGWGPNTSVTYLVATGLRTDALGIPAPASGFVHLTGTVLDVTPLTHAVKLATWDAVTYVGGHGSDDVFIGKGA